MDSAKQPERREIASPRFLEPLSVRLKQNEISQRRRCRRRNAGLCPDCGKPAVEGRSACIGCAEKVRVRAKRYYDERKKENLCIKCAGPKEADRQDKVYCRMCVVKIMSARREKAQEKRKYAKAFNASHSAAASGNGDASASESKG